MLRRRNRDRRLHERAVRHLAQYESTSDRLHLDLAVVTQRRALIATPSNSPNLPRRLNDLALCLHAQYEATGDRSLFDEAIDTQRQAVRATPGDSPDLPGRLNNLANRLADIYELSGNQDYLDEAVEAQRRAVSITPAGDPVLPTILHTLALVVVLQYKLTGRRDLLDEGVELQRRAVDLTPDNNSHLPARLNNLANQLTSLYELSGNRGCLDEAVELQRRAVNVTSPTSRELPTLLNSLAIRVAAQHAATGRRDLLDEAIEIQQRAVDLTPDTSTALPRRLGTLANRLAELYEITDDADLLQEAVEIQRRSVKATPSSSLQYALRLSNLSIRLAEQHRATAIEDPPNEAAKVVRGTNAPRPAGNLGALGRLEEPDRHVDDRQDANGHLGLLDEALEIQRRVVDATSPASTDYMGRINNLACRLRDKYDVTGDHVFLDEAWNLAKGLLAEGPWEQAMFALTRARLAWRDDRRADRYGVAASEFARVLGAFANVLQQPDLDRTRRRDLAQRLRGILGNLVASYALDGQLDLAIAQLEGDRIWLPAPDIRTSQMTESHGAVAWVVPSEWETVVITALGDGEFACSVIRRTNVELWAAVKAALNAARRPQHGQTGSRELRLRTVDDLCATTSEIAAAFPATARLLVVPLGVCALLPYAAAMHEGEHLIDHTTITLAPSLAWACAARRSKPRGPSFGVFHPGRSHADELDLAEDKRAFLELVASDVLERPSANDVLAQLARHGTIGHLSCHGTYNVASPLESSLELETDLTIRQVLDLKCSPWLVNLSACETAVHDTNVSDQMISFPTAFLLGGAAHVFATLWPVSNRHATAVNRHLYRRLASGDHPADALRHAVQHLRTARILTSSTPGRPRSPAAASDQPLEEDLHPLWWAPFTHYGSPW